MRLIIGKQEEDPRPLRLWLQQDGDDVLLRVERDGKGRTLLKFYPHGKIESFPIGADFGLNVNDAGEIVLDDLPF